MEGRTGGQERRGRVGRKGDLWGDVRYQVSPLGIDDRRYFFIHLMKTGGTTFASYVRQNFGRDEIYGLDNRAPEVTKQRNYVNVHELLRHSEARTTRFLQGHFPFVVAGLVGCDTTLTLLRDPVERTISFLHHAQRHHPEHQSFSMERIYEDSWYYPRFVDSYQLRMFSMTADEALTEPAATEGFAPFGTSQMLYEAYGPAPIEIIDVDESRLEQARENLSTVDVVGLTEEYGDFLVELEGRFGWRTKRVRRRNTSERVDVPASLRRRIEQDQALEIEFYESGRRLVRRRRERA